MATLQRSLLAFAFCISLAVASSIDYCGGLTICGPGYFCCFEYCCHTVGFTAAMIGLFVLIAGGLCCCCCCRRRSSPGQVIVVQDRSLPPYTRAPVYKGVPPT